MPSISCLPASIPPSGCSRPPTPFTCRAFLAPRLRAACTDSCRVGLQDGAHLLWRHRCGAVRLGQECARHRAAAGCGLQRGPWHRHPHAGAAGGCWQRRQAQVSGVNDRLALEERRCEQVGYSCTDAPARLWGRHACPGMCVAATGCPSQAWSALVPSQQAGACCGFGAQECAQLLPACSALLVSRRLVARLHPIGPSLAPPSLPVQMHYLKGRPANDTSGIRLQLSERPVPFSAGLLAFASGFVIPPGKPSTLVPNGCCYSGWEPLRGFATRVHTHALGRWGGLGWGARTGSCAAGSSASAVGAAVHSQPQSLAAGRGYSAAQCSLRAAPRWRRSSGPGRLWLPRMGARCPRLPPRCPALPSRATRLSMPREVAAGQGSGPPAPQALRSPSACC